MAQTNYTPISLYYSTTASAVPTAANLVPGELAINTNDGKLYYEDSSGVVQVLATKSTGSIGGSNTQVQFNNSGSLGGSSSFTWDGTTVTATKFAGALNGTVGATTASTGAFTTLSTSSTTTLSGLTASTALALDASKNVVSVTNTGTGNNVLSASPTLTGTIAGASLSLSSLTSGRVTYAGASGLLSDSANLVWDGSKLDVVNSSASGTGAVTTVRLNHVGTTVGDGAKLLFTSGTSTTGGCAIAGYGTALNAADMIFYAGGNTEKLRLTGTSIYTASGVNVGIGTSSPNAKLQVTSSSFPVLKVADAIGGGALALGDEGTNNNYVGVWRGTANSISGGGFLNVQGNGIAFMSSDNVFGSASERMRITSAGNVGIGTSSPSQPLTVNGVIASIGPATALSASSIFMDYNTTSNSGRFAAVGNTTGTAAPIYFSQYSSNASVGRDAVIIDSSGNLLVGTTTARAQITVDFNGSATNGIALNDTASGSGTVFANFFVSGTSIGSITRVGSTSAVVYNTTSDQRLKSNIEDANPVLNKLMNVKVRQFDWTEGDLHQDAGFIAQELEPVLSGIVTKGKTEDDMWQMDYARLTPYLVKAIQEQQALIESLTTRLTALENK